MATIYVLFHPQKDFTGFIGGVGFQDGRGSTSDEIDANSLVKKAGCKKMTLEEYKQTLKKKKADVKEQKGEEKAPETKQAKAESKAKK